MSPRFEQQGPGEGPRLQGFSGNGFRVNGAVYAAGVLIGLQSAVPWAPPPLDVLTPSDLDFLLAAEPRPEFVLLGTGAMLRRPPIAFLRAVEALGTGIEIMDSRAAARTYSLLATEGRLLGAALYPLDAG